MAAPRKRYDIVAGRPYSHNGEDKKQWVNVGRMTEWDDGGFSIELNAVPVGNWFDGRLSVFEAKPKNPAALPASQADPFLDDPVIPF